MNPRLLSFMVPFLLGWIEDKSTGVTACADFGVHPDIGYPPPLTPMQAGSDTIGANNKIVTLWCCRFIKTAHFKAVRSGRTIRPLKPIPVRSSPVRAELGPYPKIGDQTISGRKGKIDRQ